MKSEGLKQIERLNENEWNEIIKEDEFLEVIGQLKFTELYELEQDAQLIGKFGAALGAINPDQVENVLHQISTIKSIQERRGIPIKFTIDGGYSLVSYLKPNSIQKDNITGNECNILCKVEKLVPKCESVDFFNVKEIENKFQNRKQRRNKNKKELPVEIYEKVYGPAAVVLAFAIYK